MPRPRVLLVEAPVLGLEALHGKDNIYRDLIQKRHRYLQHDIAAVHSQAPIDADYQFIYSATTSSAAVRVAKRVRTSSAVRMV